jgi:hypothetical protein
MLFDAIGSRLESLHGMARGALAFIGALGKLPRVFVLMTVETPLVNQGFLEVGGGMAQQAIDRLMFALEGVLGS